jgi:hypothetical protein
MKQPILLKNILDILFIFLIFGTAALAILVGIFIWTPEESIPFKVDDRVVDSLNAGAFLVLGLMFLGRILFIYTIFKFKRLVSLFFKGQIFSLEQVKNIRMIGRMIIIVTLLENLPHFLYKTFFEESPRRVSYDWGNVDSFWFILAVGLFFVFLGKIFDNARKMKEENELTV